MYTGESFMGMNVVTSEYLPKKQTVKILDSFVWCTEEQRSKTNTWLLETFGFTYDVVVYKGHTLIVHPNHLLDLKKASRKFQVERKLFNYLYSPD
jgi:hypothetical protein